MFGGRCAYCGENLADKWHADHVEPIERETEFVLSVTGYGYETTSAGYTKSRATGRLRKPQNERIDNLFPACVRCNILKSNADVEGFRTMLTYFAESIPRIAGYSHVHHLMRFGKITIDPTPVIFWFEKYRAQRTEAPD
jgi:5-methylcytosine-specific restriction endonuclease McrA